MSKQEIKTPQGVPGKFLILPCAQALVYPVSCCGLYQLPRPIEQQFEEHGQSEVDASRRNTGSLGHDRVIYCRISSGEEL